MMINPSETEKGSVPIKKGSDEGCRNLCLVLGDQLNLDSDLWSEFDAHQDVVLMAEVLEESTTIASSKMRTWLFLTAMRQFAQQLRTQKYQVDYYDLSQKQPSFATALQTAVAKWQPKQVICVLPGDERVRADLEQAVQLHDIPLHWLPDRHFMAEPGEFKTWMANKKQPRMEYWYRYLRKQHGILMDSDNKPIGGAWNFDKDNRKTFGKKGPGLLNSHSPIEFDAHTQTLIEQVKTDLTQVLPDLPGQWGSFMWPTNPEQARQALQQFIECRLPQFGDFQDAMWTGEDWLYHSLLSSSLNLKLLNPREVIQAAEQAYQTGRAPINAVEGFIRQILGWREFVRGLYWHNRQSWLDFNALEASRSLPDFYWHGDTGMRCLSESLRPVLNQGYGHHIQRLMVTGLFALLWQTKPQQVHEWYLAMYVDAIAWVEIPNTIGMSQYADGGIVGSKPYIASGAYISRMSNYCQHCRYKPTESSNDQACPFNTLYWHFIETHQSLLSRNPRLGMQVKHWQNKAETEQTAIQKRAEWLFNHIESL